LKSDPPPDEVTVYPMMAEPPLETGAVKVTVAVALPAVAVPIVGAPGKVHGSVVVESINPVDVPAEFTA